MRAIAVTKFYMYSLMCVFLSLMLSVCSTGQQKDDGFKKIFDGTSLSGWIGDTTFWKPHDNSIVGQTTADHPLKANTFLIYDKEQPADFELKAEFRISTPGNSGIQYRSETVPDVQYALKGYQADIDGDNVYTGQNYEERGRGFLAKIGENAVVETGKQPQITSMIAKPDSLKSLIKKEDWNEIHIIAKGNRLRHFINGNLMSEVTDNDAIVRKAKGLIGLQIHAGPPMKVEYRNIRLKK
jgi:3-keto-disaccharide hydrolase